MATMTAWGAETGADLADECGAGDGSGVDADLIGTSLKDGCGVIGSANATTYGEGHEELGGSAADGVEEGGSAFVGSGDVEEDDLVSSGGGVAVGEFGGVASVDDIDELDAFDYAAVADIEAGDDAFSSAWAELNEVAENLQAHLCGFLWVELDAHYVAGFYGGGEGATIICNRCGGLINRGSPGVSVVYESAGGKVTEEAGFGVDGVEGVPAYVGGLEFAGLVGCGEVFAQAREVAEAGGFGGLGRAFKEPLKAYAYAEK